MMKDALYGGVNAAVLTADARRPVGRPRPHGGALPLAAGQRLQRAGGPRHHRRGQQPRHRRAHRGDGGAGRARHPRPRAAAGHRHHRDHRHGGADPRAPANSAAAARCCCRRSTTRTPPTTGCSPISARSSSASAAASRSTSTISRSSRRCRSGIELIGAAAAAPIPGRVKGVKDFSGDFANTEVLCATISPRDGFEVYCGDDGALHALLQEGGAGCITAAANVGSAVSAIVYANWDRAAGAEAQVTLAAIRKAVTSAALIPALKALVARHTGNAAWRNIRPPHLRPGRGGRGETVRRVRRRRRAAGAGRRLNTHF